MVTAPIQNSEKIYTIWSRAQRSHWKTLSYQCLGPLVLVPSLGSGPNVYPTQFAMSMKWNYNSESLSSKESYHNYDFCMPCGMSFFEMIRKSEEQLSSLSWQFIWSRQRVIHAVLTSVQQGRAQSQELPQDKDKDRGWSVCQKTILRLELVQGINGKANPGWGKVWLEQSLQNMQKISGSTCMWSNLFSQGLEPFCST